MMAFVGRADELTALDEAVGEAEAGQPRFVLFGGPPGIGKTRLLAHFADRLRDRGVLTLRTSCVELGAQGVPLVPVTTAVRQLIDQVGLEALVAIAPAAQALRRFLPEQRDVAADVPATGPLADLFAAVLHRLGTQRTVVWLVDDMQWSDRSSRDLLGFLARTMHGTRVLVALGYRDELDDVHPLRQFLAELAQLPHVRRTTLAPFTRVEVQELLLSLQPGWPVPPDRVETVFRRSGGNPFYVVELAVAGDDDRLPTSLMALLLHRVDGLSEAARRVVQVVAVAGSVEHEIVARMVGLAGDALIAAVRESVEARVLEPIGAGYALRHALLREAVVQRMLPVERARLHRVCAQALESDDHRGDDSRQDAALALHWLNAGEPAKALPELLAAAAAAGSVNAYAEQAQLLDRALQAWPHVSDAEAVTGTTLPELYEAAVAPATWAGEYDHVLDLVDQAVAHTDVSHEPARNALLLAHRAMALHHLNRDGCLEAVDRALDTVAAVRGAGRVTVLDYLASVLTLRGRPDRARELAEQARDEAAALRDHDLSLETATTLGWVLSEEGDYQTSITVLQQAERLARHGAGAVQRARLHLNLAVVHHGLGRYDDAIQAAQTGIGSLRAPGLDRTLGMGLLLIMTPALIARGRLEEADAVIARGLARDPPPSMALQFHALSAEVSLIRGDLDMARRDLRAARVSLGRVTGGEISPRGGGSAPWELPLIRQEADLALAEGRPAAAVEAVDRVLPLSRGAPHDAWAVLFVGARALAHPGAPSHASSRRAQLQDAAAKLARDTPAVAAYAAQFDAATGSETTWMDAATAWDACGHVINRTSCLVRSAEAIHHTDRPMAQTLLQEAAKTATAAGAGAILSEIRVLASAAHLELDDLGGERVESQLGLTPREMEVLSMVADGWSNRQIGAALYISPKTVSVHVSNILAKLMVSSRGEAAALAHRSGLFDR